MCNLIGIRREDKNLFERRAPLTPAHVAALGRDQGLAIKVQPSERRIFGDQAYRDAGATLDDDLSDCPIIMGIKEVPPAGLMEGKAYLYFSHTAKGQPYNMDMLRRLLELDCTLLDYERIVDDQGRRLIFFGRHAGLAGMIDTLWALGQRLELEGIQSPLAMLRQCFRYQGLEAALQDVKRVGELLRRSPLPPPLRPLVFGVSGYGNVSLGAQEVLAHLGVQAVAPADLAEAARPRGDGPTAIKVVFKERHLVRPLEGDFKLRHYYAHPEAYRADFYRHLEHLHVLVNCIYWEPRFPRLVSNEDLGALYAGGARLRVIGDISCDVGGSVQATLKATEPDTPVFVYDLDSGQARDGLAGNGPVIMAVDNLPAELPREASEHFSQALLGFAPALAAADFSAGCAFDDLALPAPLKRAAIVHRGRLTPSYTYLEKHL